MLKYKKLKEIEPSEKVISVISSTKPNELKIVNGKIILIEITNIKTIVPIKYYINYNYKNINDDYKEVINKLVNENVIYYK